MKLDGPPSSCSNADPMRSASAVSVIASSSAFARCANTIAIRTRSIVLDFAAFARSSAARKLLSTLAVSRVEH